MKEKYTIELTKKQLELLSFIADKYSRLMAGQLTIALEDVLVEAGERHRKDLTSYEIQELAEDKCVELEETFWNLFGGKYYGINYSENYNILTDINHVIRHFRYLERGETQKVTVDAYPAHKFSKEPLIEVRKSEGMKCSGCYKPMNDGLCGNCCSDLVSGNY